MKISRQRLLTFKIPLSSKNKKTIYLLSKVIKIIKKIKLLTF